MNNYFTGNLTITGNKARLNVDQVEFTDNIIEINTNPVAGRDSGIIMPLHVDDIKNPQYTNTFISTTSTSAEINEIIESGWMVEVVLTGEKKIISNVIGTTIYVNWTTQPNPGDTYRLYRDTNAAMIYKEGKFYLGHTANSAISTIVDITPAPIISTINTFSTLLVSDIRVANTDFIKIASFTWIDSIFNTFPNGRLIFWSDSIIDIKLTDGTDYINGSYSGYQSINFTNPSTNTVLSLEVRGNAVIRGVTLFF